MTVDEFVALHGFPGTPAGDRMRDNLIETVTQAHNDLSEVDEYRRQRGITD